MGYYTTSEMETAKCSLMESLDSDKASLSEASSSQLHLAAVNGELAPALLWKILTTNIQGENQ